MKIQLNFYSCLYDSMFQKLITLDANDVTKLIDSLSEVSEDASSEKGELESLRAEC